MRRIIPLLFLAACATSAPPDDPASAELVGDTGFPYPTVPPGPLRTAIPGAALFIVGDPMPCWLAVNDPLGRLRIDVVGVSSGRTDVLQAVSLGTTFHSSSIAKVGDQLAVTGTTPTGNRVILMNAITGRIRASFPVAATQLKVGGAKLWGEFLYPRPWRRYDSAANAYADVGTDFTVPDLYSLGNGADLVPASTGFGPEISLLDPATGAVARTVELQGFNWGHQTMQQTPEHIVMLDFGGARYSTDDAQILSVFDATTGANQSNLALPGPDILGFVCDGSLP